MTTTLLAPARTIPDEAWQHASRSVIREGQLYPDLWHMEDGVRVYDDCQDPELVHWLSFFTLENYAEWVGAVCIAPRAPLLEETMVRFDALEPYIEHGHTNPYRAPGVPDWYFFWDGRGQTRAALKKFAREAGLIPKVDLPLGQGGHGADDGLAGRNRKAAAAA
ncbi:hypothetical protein LG293_16025 (plasmid) [Citricoccus nitrophenolicus]